MGFRVTVHPPISSCRLRSKTFMCPVQPAQNATFSTELLCTLQKLFGGHRQTRRGFVQHRFQQLYTPRLVQIIVACFKSAAVPFHDDESFHIVDVSFINFPFARSHCHADQVHWIICSPLTVFIYWFLTTLQLGPFTLSPATVRISGDGYAHAHQVSVHDTVRAMLVVNVVFAPVDVLRSLQLRQCGVPPQERHAVDLQSITNSDL